MKPPSTICESTTGAPVSVAGRQLRSGRTSPRVLVCFAYGSNLDEGQMRRRCPTARRMGRAQLPGHALTFGGYSHGWGGPVASVVRQRQGSVPGLLYAVSLVDIDQLDRFEGCPFAYERVRRIVVNAEGARRLVQLYRQPEDTLQQALPSWNYLRVISEAYKRHRLDGRALLRALKELP